MWLWTTRMPETLPPERRRRLDRADITDSYLTFLRTRPTIWFSISSVFLQAVFTMYLASSELIVSEIFDRRNQFPLVFGAIAVGFGVGALVNGRVVGIFGVRPVITTMLTVLVIGSTGLLALTVAADGTPSFWVFMPALGALLAMFMFIMPNLNAEAMQPVPQIAGTVSSLSGALRMAGGAVLGGVVAARIDTSLTPFATALLGFSVLAGLSVWFGARTAAETRPSAG
jgi:DHA1 family bicyclomycin/chloramphenicol resistance-like MFS transporter